MHRELIEIDVLLTPLNGPSPCGPDLSYDPEFLALERAATGRSERQAGDRILPAELPDWPTVLDQAVELSQKTRDLRVAVIVWRAAIGTLGLAGAALGLELIHGLLACHWAYLHPVLDDEDGQDPTMRLSVLVPLCVIDQGLAELRQAHFAPAHEGLTFRAVELALTRATAMPDEQALTEAEVMASLESLFQRHPEIADAAQRAHASAIAIASLMDSQSLRSVKLDFAPLVQLLQLPLTALARRAPQPMLPAPVEQEAPVASHGVAADLDQPPLQSMANPDQSPPQAAATEVDRASVARYSRADVERQFDEQLRWFKANEPSHPAPLLIRRIQRWMSMDFLELVQDLEPELLPQFERATGVEHQPHTPDTQGARA